MANTAPQFPDEVNRMFSAFSNAETGGEANPWIRTRVAPSAGSTAFGPVQLTYNTAKDYAARGKLSPASMAFFQNQMAPMYQNFQKYGREPNRPGYSPQYDYGGSGGFDWTQNGDQYAIMSKEIMQDMYNRSGGDVSKAVQMWRGVPANADPRYFKKFMQEYQ